VAQLNSSSETKVEKRTVTLIRGDGIGAEITSAIEDIFDAASVPIVWEAAGAGLACIEKYGTGLPSRDA